MQTKAAWFTYADMEHLRVSAEWLVIHGNSTKERRCLEDTWLTAVKSDHN